MGQLARRPPCAKIGGGAIVGIRMPMCHLPNKNRDSFSSTSAVLFLLFVPQNYQFDTHNGCKLVKSSLRRKLKI